MHPSGQMWQGAACSPPRNSKGAVPSGCAHNEARNRPQKNPEPDPEYKTRISTTDGRQGYTLPHAIARGSKYDTDR